MARVIDPVILWDGAKKGLLPLAKAVCEKFNVPVPMDLYDFLRSEQKTTSFVLLCHPPQSL